MLLAFSQSHWLLHRIPKRKWRLDKPRKLSPHSRGMGSQSQSLTWAKRIREKETQDEFVCPQLLHCQHTAAPPFIVCAPKAGSFKFIELWYFTVKGCMDATKFTSKSQANNTSEISRADNHLTASQASNNALQDREALVWFPPPN